jgi:hypothetical protein
MIEIINFQPFLALALFMPLLSSNSKIQYGLPLMALTVYYLASVGLDIAQLGYFASVVFATFIGKRLNMFKAYFVSMFGYHILANLSHGNPFTIAALEFDASTFTATAFYLLLFKTIEKIWQTVYQEV